MKVEKRLRLMEGAVYEIEGNLLLLPAGAREDFSENVSKLKVQITALQRMVEVSSLEDWKRVEEDEDEEARELEEGEPNCTAFDGTKFDYLDW